MIEALRTLSAPALRGLAAAMGERRLALPCAGAQLRGIVPEGREPEIAEALNRTANSTNTELLAGLIGLLADERAQGQAMADRIDLVWSGPEAPGSLNRDTAVVIRELFEEAERRVLIASYVLDAGDKARAIFEPLAARLDAGEPLDVSLFVNIERRRRDSRGGEEIVAEYMSRFREAVWPGRTLPTVYHDPRALDHGGPTRACLHAKCVVIDERVAIVTSANFTEAAQLRNIETGVLVRDTELARALADQFEALVRSRDLRRA